MSRVIIAGAGAAGISAAICLAKRGFYIDLFESHSSIGGIVARGLLHTLGGFLLPSGDILPSPICDEFIRRIGEGGAKRKMGRHWVLQVRPEDYGKMVTRWLAEFKNIHLHLQEKPNVGYCDDFIYVDATANACLARQYGAQTCGPHSASFAVVLYMRLKSEIELGLLRRTALKLEIEKFLPSDISVWIDKGFENDDVYIKMNSKIENLEPFIENVLECLKDLSLIQIGEISSRYGDQVVGLDPHEDITEENSFPVSWPFEKWNGAQVEISIPPQMPFRIFEGYLRSRSHQRLFAVGKSAGLPPSFLDAGRVVGSCWVMGEHAAKMIARDLR